MPNTSLFDQLSPEDQTLVQMKVEEALDIQQTIEDLITGMYDDMHETIEKTLHPDIWSYLNSIGRPVNWQENPLESIRAVASYTRTRLAGTAMILGMDYAHNLQRLEKRGIGFGKAVDDANLDIQTLEMLQDFIRCAHLKAHIEATHKTQAELYEFFSQPDMLAQGDKSFLTVPVEERESRYHAVSKTILALVTKRTVQTIEGDGGIGFAHSIPVTADNMNENQQLQYVNYIQSYFLLPWQRTPENMQSVEWRSVVIQREQAHDKPAAYLGR